MGYPRNANELSHDELLSLMREWFDADVSVDREHSIIQCSGLLLKEYRAKEDSIRIAKEIFADHGVNPEVMQEFKKRINIDDTLEQFRAELLEVTSEADADGNYPTSETYVEMIENLEKE